MTIEQTLMNNPYLLFILIIIILIFDILILLWVYNDIKLKGEDND